MNIDKATIRKLLEPVLDTLVDSTYQFVSQLKVPEEQLADTVEKMVQAQANVMIATLKEFKPDGKF
jgi:maltodextrin utilization protein YvdJ